MKFLFIALSLSDLLLAVVMMFSGDIQLAIFWVLVAIVMAIFSLHFKDN